MTENHPYIIAILIVRNLSMKRSRPILLYVGMTMIIIAFIAFMLLGRRESDYIIVDTMMLGACGIFDLFWWSIIGEMLEYSENPAKIFGIGLSANVMGVLCGDIIGVAVTSSGLPHAQITVIALCVVCVTLCLLPPLNRQLTLLLKNHIYLAAYSEMSEREQHIVIEQAKPFDPLTKRENDVLKLILDGRSNKEIAEELSISDNTVKTHLRSIFSKYDIASRAELISTLLKNRA